jgi:hypothetical protein
LRQDRFRTWRSDERSSRLCYGDRMYRARGCPRKESWAGSGGNMLELGGGPSQIAT